MIKLLLFVLLVSPVVMANTYLLNGGSGKHPPEWKALYLEKDDILLINFLGKENINVFFNNVNKKGKVYQDRLCPDYDPKSKNNSCRVIYFPQVKKYFLLTTSLIGKSFELMIVDPTLINVKMNKKKGPSFYKSLSPAILLKTSSYSFPFEVKEKKEGNAKKLVISYGKDESSDPKISEVEKVIKEKILEWKP